MKRIIALLLCICMLALCLTSCGDSGKTDLEGHSRDLLTLKMAVLVDEHTTKEGAAAMAKAFNQIYQQTFSTAVEFDFFTPEEYISAMADFEAADAEYKFALEEYEAAKTLYEKRKNGENKTDYEAKKTVYEEKLAAYEAACVLTGKYGYTVSALDKDNPASAEYPSVKTNQYDILVMTDKAMYQKSVENGWVASLNTLLSGTYSVLNTKVLNNIAAMMRVNDETYGIPARKVMGEYTYLKVNNEVLDFYNIPASQIKTIADGYSVFATMNTYGEGMGLDKWEAKYEESFAPILNPEEDFVYGNVKYMSLDGGFSLVGSVYDKDSVKTSGDASKQILQIGNLLENTNYARFMQMQFEAKKNGYYGTGEEENCILGIVTGDYGLRDSNDGYTYVVIDSPRYSDDVFTGTLAVSSRTVKLERSVELIQNLMTNSELLNLLLFGESKENYSIDSDGLISFRAKYNYAMNKDYMVGNLVECAYPCSDYGQNAKTYANASLQNAEAKAIIFTDSFFDSFSKVDTEAWTGIDTLSQTYLERLMSCTDMDAFLSEVEAVNGELRANNDFQYLVYARENADAPSNEEDVKTLYGSYFKYIYNK